METIAIKPTAVISRMIRNVVVVINYSPFHYIGREDF